MALILVPSPDSLLLIRRAERPGDPWSGHMALPGGRHSAGDEDLVATAVRETEEEVGVHLDPRSLLGALEDVIPRTPTLPPIAVRPFVFFLPSRPTLRLNPEVSGAAWVILDQLLQAGSYRPAVVQVRGESREFPAYHLEDAFVWGMTERILTELLERFRQPES